MGNMVVDFEFYDFCEFFYKIIMILLFICNEKNLD